MSLSSNSSSKMTKLPQIDMKKIAPADRDNYFGHQVGIQLYVCKYVCIECMHVCMYVVKPLHFQSLLLESVHKGINMNICMHVCMYAFIYV